MSIFLLKRKLLADGGVARGGDGGGGGGGGPTQTTSYNTNIPEYAQPYVMGMLGATQKQIYNDDNTSFRPYQPYSSDVNNYFAGFSPLQQQAQQAAYNMQMPGQYAMGSALAGSAGMQALNAQDQANMLGSQALGYGQAGQMYGGLGAEQALSQAQQTAQQAGMYGGMGAGYGAQAARLAPEAQMYGQGAANIGMGGIGYGALGAGYGAQGAQAAQQGFGAGAQYAQQATNPAATAAYMSPYMQNVVDYQKSQALRDYNIANQVRNAQAVSSGAFGGSRQAIQGAEAQRNLMSQLQGIEATGAQQAFQNAQAQQQFGANLGLQGLQAGYQGLGLGLQGAQAGLSGLGTAMQGQQAGLQGLQQAGQLYGQGMQGAGVGLQGVGAQQAAGQLSLAGTAQGMQGAGMGLQGVGQATQAGQYGLQGLGQATQAAGQLGQLGSQQQAADIAMQNQQASMGKQQQDLEQQKINQAIQNYAIQQQYPMMQLGFMSNMLRGLPLQAQTTQLYQAQPSTAQQAIGLLGAGSTLFGRKEGGIINSYKEGGEVGYKYGGAIPEPKLAGMAENLSIAQLQQRIKDPQLDDGERQVFKDALEDKAREKARYAGIGAAGGGLFNTMGLAGGGIIAFADEGEVKDPEKLADQINLIGAQLDTVNKEAYGNMGPGSKQRAFSPEKTAEYENLKKRQNELKGEYADLMTKAGLDKPAIGYRSGVAPTTLYPNAVEQAVLGTKPEEKSAMPTAGEFKSFDDAADRFVKEQKTKGTAGAPSASEGSKAPGSPSPLMQATAGKSLADFLAERKAAGPKGQVGEDFEKFITERLGSSADRLSRDERMAIAKGFLKFGSTPAPGGIGQAAIAGLGEYATGVEAARKSQDAMELEMQKMRKDLEVARRAEERGDVEGAQKAYDSAADRQNRIQAAQISASAAGQTQRAEAAKIDRLMKENPGMTYKDALQFVAGAGRTESNDITALKTAIAAKQNDLYAPGVTKEDRARIQQEIAALQQRLVAIGMSGVASGGGNPTGGKVDTNNPLLKG